MSTVQPIWITPPGSLGTVPEGSFYQVPLVVDEPGGDPVYFEAIAGALPSGIECTQDGVIQGVPTNVVTVADEAIVSGATVTSKFAIRAYTTKTVGGITVINRLADRTFTLTVAGQNNPTWITPAGSLGNFFYTGQLLEPGIQLEYTNDNTTGIPPAITLYSGSLPTGLTLSPTGLISGFVSLNPAISLEPGFDRTPFDGTVISPSGAILNAPFDFDLQSLDANYEFTLRVTNGRTSALRTFSMYIWSTDTFNASTTEITADNTDLTVDISTYNTPVILNTPGSIGTAPNGTFFAYQFIGEDINGAEVGFTGYFIPPGLQLDTETGWLTGYLPSLGLTEETYGFGISAYTIPNPEVISLTYQFSLTVTGPISTNVTWLTPSNLGSISNGSTSMFYVEATTTAGLPLQYRLALGSDSRLPQGLTLLPSGHIAGRVSFNTFALDLGTTTFDNDQTTFDLNCTFTVNAYSINGYVSVNKTFTINVLRTYDKPYENLYIECMPPVNDRQLIGSLVQNNTIFPPASIYRNDDPNFGVSSNVIYYHAYGLNAVNIDTYVESLQLNHYWKNLTLGQIETARAVDPITGTVIYEVVYSKIIDTLVNNEGVSVDKEVILPYVIEDQTVNTVFPNSLENMRNQVIDVVGQESNILPLWMQSVQSDGNVLGFTPAWVIAYTVPGQSGQIQYNIQSRFGTQLNQVDFEADRYELDSALTVNWDAETQEWIPTPPESTTFDISYHYNIVLTDGGTGYEVNDQIKILGTELGGITPLNDCLITVNTVSDTGAIISAFYQGTASMLVYGNEYPDTVGTNISGTGAGALWTVIPVPGLDATIPATTQWLNDNNTSVSWTNDTGLVTVWTYGGTTTFDTQFDGGSLTFSSPADVYTNTDAYNKYLLYPKTTILG